MYFLLWNGSQTQPEKQLVTTIVFILVFHSRAYLDTWIIIIVYRVHIHVGLLVIPPLKQLT